MATTSQMLGKLETIFSYMTPFFLHTWPKGCPGFLFLTDLTGSFITYIPLQSDQVWNPSYFAVPESTESLHEIPALVRKAIHTKEIVLEEEQDFHSSVLWGILPIQEKNGFVRATVGIAIPSDVKDVDLMPYIKSIESLILVGYDVFIQQGTGEIVLNANRFERSAELMRYVVDKVAEVLDKGLCLAFKLDHRGHILSQERISSSSISNENINNYIIDRLSSKKLSLISEERFVVYPIYCEDKPLYALVLYIPLEEDHVFYDERDVFFLQSIGEKISLSLRRAIHADNLSRDSKKKELLYQLTMKIQATIDVNEVLEEIINSIHLLYPYFNVELYLSVETNTTLPVKPLSFQTGEHDFSNQAYMEGRPVVGTQMSEEGQVTVLAAPLLGKQGIYGVLQLTTTELVNLLDNETNYISILAETAGTAFENAQLYQQSRNMIRELRLINEMAQQLNRSLNLDEILQFVKIMLLETFEAEYCAILRQVDDGDNLVVLTSSKEEDTGKIVSAREQPLLDLVIDKRGIILANPCTETMPFSLIPFASMMGVPLLQGSEITGVVFVSDTRRHFFSFDDFKLLEIVAQHASLAVTNALLHSEVERMVITDNLTGLYARRYLNERVQHSLEHDGFGSLIVLDIDYFKKVNDTYGHQVGDEVLIQVSNLIKRNIRDSDIAARWGGEEIAIYLPRVDTPMALMVAERIRFNVETETKPRVTISSGVSKWDRQTHHNLSVELLFHNADIALYDAKRTGRNQVKLAY